MTPIFEDNKVVGVEFDIDEIVNLFDDNVLVRRQAEEDIMALLNKFHLLY